MKAIRAVVIDDEELITDVIKAYMQSKDAIVFDFNNARQGLEFIQANHQDINLVVTDFKMPGSVTGGDIYAWVTSNCPHIVCYIVTGFIDVRPEGIEQEHIVVKPIDFDDFLLRVRHDIGVKNQ